MDGTTTSTAFQGYSSPWRNLAWSFRKSRDQWKSKHQRLKREHKKLQNQLRDVRKSRTHWHEVAEECRRQVQEREQEIAQLQAELAAARVGGEKKG